MKANDSLNLKWCTGVAECFDTFTSIIVNCNKSKYHSL